MRRFAALYATLDRTTATGEKVAAMAAYFRDAPPEDAAWAIYILSGRKLKRLVTSTELRDLAVTLSGYPAWLLDDCYSHVGDLAETLDLLLDAPIDDLENLPLHVWIEQRLAALPSLPPEIRADHVRTWWHALPHRERFMLNKLLTGSLRVGVSQRLVVQALAQASGLESALVAHRLMGDWQPSASNYGALIESGETPADVRKPYPFFLASPLEAPAESLGAVSEWLAERKWDGIRVQLLRRDGGVQLWSRGEERMDGRFPEIEQAALHLPDGCVVDGELLAWRDGAPLPFTALQKRIGRLAPSAKLIADCPLVLMCYDVLEEDGVDIRTRPLAARREALVTLVNAAADPHLLVSPDVAGASWETLALERERARELGVEGLILKRLTSPYQVGRRRGDWWKWKIDPYTLDAVLLYAQPGHGRRSNLYTDYTFAVWDGDALVPVAKAYSGLTDAEIATLDRWIRAHTTERFGPVRALVPHHVFELAFEAINASSRHKSGVAVRFPRILRWRTDLGIKDADTLDQLKSLARS